MKFRIYLKSFNTKLIGKACEQFHSILGKANCQVGGMVALPMKMKKFCVLRSPHVDKDSREHFELRIYKRFFDLTVDSPSLLDLLLKTELPSGVFCSLKVLPA
jgi:small subunit ribosomal protein S10